MFIKGMAFFLGLFLSAGVSLAADKTIYEIINSEDQFAFSNMVALGFDIDQSDSDGYTPLMIASSLGKIKFVEFLIDNGADVNLRSHTGLTALHRAAQDGHNEVIAALLLGGANINIPDMAGFTPLMVSVIANQRFCVEFLIKRGANINFRNADGDTALRISDRKKFYDLSKYLRQQGATY
ncbi:MAG: ankyrin repeat domain-containing protein [Acetobacter sp.]|nr:ankyrin repeat domain-containing protein [Acetobacter sp.]